MKKIITCLTLILFCLWLMPLTLFVKPSQDALVCNGQRAICLCRVQKAEASKVNPIAKVAYQSGQTETPKESSGGLPPQFLVRSMFDGFAVLREFRILSENNSLYSFLKESRIDHVPKFA